ncbi:hypothetical protein [Xenorhabdus aichiensis]
MGGWLAESGFLDQPITVETAYGTIVIRAELPIFLA